MVRPCAHSGLLCPPHYRALIHLYPIDTTYLQVSITPDKQMSYPCYLNGIEPIHATLTELNLLKALYEACDFFEMSKHALMQQAYSKETYSGERRWELDP